MHRFMFVTVALGVAVGGAGAQEPPGKIELLPGYKHEKLQGIDSIVGKIVSPKGLDILYEIGRVRQPGGLALGGDFSDRAKGMPPPERRWYKEQRLAGQEVHLAYSKKDLLVVTYPAHGVLFSVTVRTPDEMAEALLMILSFRGNKE